MEAYRDVRPIPSNWVTADVLQRQALAVLEEPGPDRFGDQLDRAAHGEALGDGGCGIADDPGHAVHDSPPGRAKTMAAGAGRHSHRVADVGQPGHQRDHARLHPPRALTGVKRRITLAARGAAHDRRGGRGGEGVLAAPPELETAEPRGAGHRHRLDVRIVGIDLVTRHPRRVGVAERTPAGVVAEAGARRDLPAITAPQI